MVRPYLKHLLRPFGAIQDNEIFTTLLMFSYSFLAMSAYNIIQPIQRTLFIEKLGANSIPYVQLAAGVLIGVIMTGYAWLMSRLPRRWAIPLTQVGIVILLLAFWFLFRTRPDQKAIAVGFYIFGNILGILLISQFWTLANVVYDPRQAKRLFGFIGGGSSLGGVLGASISAFLSAQVGTINLLLISAAFMLCCMTVVIFLIRREKVGELDPSLVAEERKGVGARKAFDLLQKTPHLRLIALVIGFGAIGAAIIDQQLNMATEIFKRQGGLDAMNAFLGGVRVYVSTIGFVIQIALTSRIHRYLGVGFALLLLPMGLGATAVVILLNAVLWAPALARIFDQSLRYTVDKTTREILYMPLPNEIKYEAKPFVDVTLDRVAKGMTAVVVLVLISPWGLGLNWQQLSYASAVLTLAWIVVAVRARHGYQSAFRQSIQARQILPSEVRLDVADLSTVEALIQELASPDERRVLYAIDMLESLDKRNLITPLLLYHESPTVRVRSLGLVAGILPEESARWLPAIQRMMADDNPEVRAAAVGTLANIRDEQVASMVRPYLQDGNPRIALTAAMVLSCSSQEEDALIAEKVLEELMSETRESASLVRRDFAIALRHVPSPRFRRLLIPLLHDTNLETAEAAMRTVQILGVQDFIFVPTLISLLRNRRLKSRSRELLVGSGEQVLNILQHFLRDEEENIWVRRAIPGTIARIACQKSMDNLIAALEEPDGFLRFQIIAAIERLHRTNPEITFNRELIESMALKEGERYSGYLLSYRRLFVREKLPANSLLARALTEKMGRSLDRMYRLLGLLYSWQDIFSARWAIEHSDTRSRSAALEYLDNLFSGSIRKKLMPVLEASKLSGGFEGPGKFAKETPGGVEESVLRLVQDPDPVLSATSVFFVWEAKLENLRDKLEELLLARDARHPDVYEASSWVLAAFRAQESKRGAPWFETLPAVEVAKRLRGIPLFSSVSVYGLFRIAGAAGQLRLEPGQVVCQESIVPERLHFLLDGRVSCRSLAGETLEVESPAALGYKEVLEGRLMGETVQVTETALLLVFSGEEFWTHLADDSELVQGLFRMLCGTDEEDAGGFMLKEHWETGRTVIPGTGLKSGDKMLVLQNLPIFSELNAEEMIALSSIAAEVRFTPGAMLFKEADPPALYALASGELSLESAQEKPPISVGPQDVIGVRQVLAGTGLGYRARVVREGAALRIDREDFFDLLAQRPDLLRQLLTALSASRPVRNTSRGSGIDAFEN